MYRKKIAALAISSLIVCMPIFAQEGFDDGKMGLRMYSSAGYQMLDVESLNSMLTDEGYPELSDDMLALGMMWQSMKNRWIMRTEAHWLISESGENTSYTSNISALSGFVNWGYMVFSNTSLELSPLLGAGLGGTMVTLTPTDDASFDNVLQDPTGLQLKKGSVLFKLGVDFSYLINIKEDNYGKGMMSFGIDAGYILDPFDSSWRMKKVELDGGPDTGLGGPYVRLTMGFGFYARESKINVD